MLTPVQNEGACPPKGPLLLNYDSSVEQITGLQFENALLQPNQDGVATRTVCLQLSRIFGIGVRGHLPGHSS